MLKTSPIAQKEHLTIDDLRDADFVLPQSDLFIQIAIDLCEAHGFSPSISHYSHYFDRISVCLSSNNEVFFTDRFLLDYYNDRCTYRDLPEITSGVMMAVRKHETNAHVESFKRMAVRGFQLLGSKQL